MSAIALIGPMAAGKSSVGRRLAKRLGTTFVDTDKAIAREHGPIPTIFAEQGEPRFRELEAAAVRDAVAGGGVVSLGGGAVLHEGTRTLLADCTVVLLTIDDGTAERRISRPGRPLLADGGIEAWRRILAEREPTYRALADRTVDTSHRPMSAIVDEIATWLEESP